MGILRVIVAFIAIALLATIAFGQESQQGYYLAQNQTNGQPLPSATDILLDENLLNPNTRPSDTLEEAPQARQPTQPSRPQMAPSARSFNVENLPVARGESPTAPQSSSPVVPEVTAQDTPSIFNTRQPQVDAPQEPLQPNQPTTENQTTFGLDIPMEMESIEGVRNPEDIARIGVLTPANGGFNETLWGGLSRERASTILQRIRKEGLKSQAARRLLQRTLLTTATPPAGEGEQNWLAERARTLHELGMVESAGVLLDNLRAEDLNLDRGLGRVWAENALMSGDISQGCLFIRQYVLNSDQPFWRRALLTCQALEGDSSGLQLSLDLTTEEDKRADPLLYNLLLTIHDNSLQSPRLLPETRFSPLHTVLYTNFPSLLTPDVIYRLPDVALRQVATNKGLDISQRLQAAEKLVNDFSVGGDIELLANLYDSIEFTEEQLRTPMQYAKQEQDGSMARALLWQAARSAGIQSAKALVLRNLWSRSEEDELHDLPSALTPDVVNIRPDANLAWFSPYVIRYALRGGNLPVARKWWNILEGNRTLSRDLSLERVDLSIAFSMLDKKLQDSTLEDWWSTRRLVNPHQRLKAERTLSILEAADLQVPAEIWKKMHMQFNDANLDHGKGPGALWLRLLATSLEEQRLGEAVLMLVEPMMYNHPAKMSPQGVSNVVTGLRFLGLEEDAIIMGLEAMLHDTEQGVY